jgi:chromosomal replication initiation ATPase DnaA
MNVFETHSSPSVVDAGVQDVWRRCLDKIQKQVTSLGFKTWFQPIVPIKLVEKDITVQVPSQFFYDWVDQHYNALIRETISSVLGDGAKLYYSIASEDVEPVLQIEQVALGQPALSREVSPAMSQLPPFFPPRTAFRQSDQPIAQSNLNPTTPSRTSSRVTAISSHELRLLL